MVIAFASDYGLADEFVGVCKAVMLGLAPDVRILDVSHDIPAHDVRAGALLLVRAVQYLPDDCVVVAVVDPGVGTDRRLVGVEVAGGVLLGPDNGLLAPAVAHGGRRPDRRLARQPRLPAAGARAHVRRARRPRPRRRPPRRRRRPRRARAPPSTRRAGARARRRCPRCGDDGAIVGEVWWVDRFGNCQLNIDPDELSASAGRAGRAASRCTSAASIRAARWVHTYADAKPSELVLLVDSYGLLCAGPRPGVGGRGAAAAGRAAASRWCPRAPRDGGTEARRS